MAVVRKRPKRRRLQISLLQQEYELAKELASECGTSIAEVFRSGLGLKADERRRWEDPLRDFIGTIKDGPTDGSVTIDEVVYGDDIHG